MNRSYSRFVPHNRPAHPRRDVGTFPRNAFRPHREAANRPVQQRAGFYSNRPLHRRPSYQGDRFLSKDVRSGRRVVSSQVRRLHQGVVSAQGARSYWFPIATMMAAVLFAFSAIIPGSIFDAFAADTESFSIIVDSRPGLYAVTVTGGNSTCTDMPAESAVKTDNHDGTVTFTIDLSERTIYTIDSDAAMKTVSFGSVPPGEGDETDSTESLEEISSQTTLYGETDCPVTTTEKGESTELTSEAATEVIQDTDAAERAGAEAVLSVDLSKSGVTSLDISRCTGLKSLNISGTPLEQDVSSISLSNPDGGRIELSVPAFNDVNEEGVEFELSGFGDADELTVKLANGTGIVPYEAEDLEGVHYYIPYTALKTAFESEDSSEIQITRNSNPNTVYFMPIAKKDFNSETVNPSESEPTTQTGDDGNTLKTTTTTAKTGTNTDKADDSDNKSPNVKLTVEEKSKSVIKDAYIENVEGVDASKYKIVAKALSASDKKTFLAAVKKKDKDFNDSDANLLVYDIYVVDSKGNKADLKGKAAVTATLAYPSYEVEYLKDEYDFAVYHQLADKSIDTSINASATKEGIQFTTDSFSNFAISCAKKEQKYTDLVIHEDSKKIITSAKAHEGTYFTVKDDAYEDEKFQADRTWIMAEAPTADEKKEFFDAIKKINKDFNEKDANLIVYKVSLRNIQIDQPSYMSENGKVDFTLAYPNDTLKKNYTRYDYTVYHQLADKSIDTKQLAIAGKDGVTVTTDSFSLFAVASSPKPQNSDNPKTGEANVSANIALLLAMLSMVSFAAVYAKNKAEQY